MVRGKTEATTPPEILEQLLRSAGPDVVLIGGQALAYWVQHYGLALPDGVRSISDDVDLLARSVTSRDVVSRMATVLRGSTWFPELRELTILVGRAFRELGRDDLGEDTIFNVDVLFKMSGLSRDAVHQRAVRVELGVDFFMVMHPLHVLQSRLVNLHELEEKKNAKGQMQLALAIDVVRRHVQHVAKQSKADELSSGRSPIQPLVSEIERLALEGAGRNVAKRYGVHVADAIDPSPIPAGPFWEKKWPTLRRLMSPEYAARFTPPVS